MRKKLVELQLSRTASNVLREFEAVIIDTAKIKLFWPKTKPKAKLRFHWTRLSFIISMQILVTDTWSSFCRTTEQTIQSQRPWKAAKCLCHSINGITRGSSFTYHYHLQTSQVSRFCRETHDFQLNLTVSRYATKISRFLENLAFFKENLPFFSVPKNFKSLFKNQAILKNKFSHKEQKKIRSARGLSPKNPYLENQCQIRLSLAISLSHTKPRPRDILVQIKVADFEEIETLMVFL